MRTVVVARIALVAAIAAGCSDSSHDITDDTAEILPEPAMTPANATVHIGDVQQFAVTPRGSGYSRWLWRVSDTTVATVDSTGLVHTRKNGTTTVIASAAAAPSIGAGASLTVVP